VDAARPLVVRAAASIPHPSTREPEREELHTRFRNPSFKKLSRVLFPGALPVLTGGCPQLLILGRQPLFTRPHNVQKTLIGLAWNR